MAQSAFAKAFATKAGKVFDKAKTYKHREGNSFGPVDVPDGTYSAVITNETSVPTKGKMEGIPIVRIKACITTGTHEGKEPSQSFFCEGKPPVAEGSDEMPTAEQQLLGLLAWLLPDVEIDDQSQVPEALDLLNKRGPLAIIGIKNSKSKTDPTKIYQNLYFNKLVNPFTFEEATAEAEATNKAPQDHQEDPTTDYVPAKGDPVFLEDDDAEYEVARVSQAKQTVSLANASGEVIKNGVPWSALQPA